MLGAVFHGTELIFAVPGKVLHDSKAVSLDRLRCRRVVPKQSNGNFDIVDIIINNPRADPSC